MPTIAVIAGDGVGPEVVDEGLRVLKRIEETDGLAFETVNYPFGAEHYLKTGESMPPSVIGEFKEMDAILLGAIDTSQLVNVWHKVENASREGARVAVRSTTDNTSDVETAVASYLAAAFPRASSENLSSGLTVVVRNANGTVVSGTGLNSIPEGNSLTVEVSLDCDSVRWLNGAGIMYGQNLSTTTMMRRE